MKHPTLKKYLLSLPESMEDFPFGPDAAVYKIKGKIFAIVFAGKESTRINLKCDPAEAVELRFVFAAVKPGYHMNKKHWNTVVIDGSVPEAEIKRMMVNSYRLVVRGLPRSERLGLEMRSGYAGD
jgi:predicted DNA-binding protein (MmcQ/YjbR family)